MFKGLCKLFTKKEAVQSPQASQEEMASTAIILFRCNKNTIYTDIVCGDNAVNDLQLIMDMTLSEDAQIYILDILQKNNPTLANKLTPKAERPLIKPTDIFSINKSNNETK